jgi:hypothetical protein
MDEDEEDEWIEQLPLLDEHGYPVLTDADGNEILDDWEEPIRTGFGCNQIEPVDVVSHVTFVVRQTR